MKVLVVSDTHGRINNLQIVLSRVRPIDLLLHLGDIGGDKAEIEREAACPLLVVPGNNDWLLRVPQEQVFELGRHRVLMTHGHRYGVYSGTKRLKDHAREHGADIVFYGHTHVPELDLGEDVWAMNPGSLTYPRNGSRYSYLVLDVDGAGEIHPTLCTV